MLPLSLDLSKKTPNVFKKLLKSSKKNTARTVSVRVGEGHGRRVSVNDVQEEVGRVIVGLTGVSWEMELILLPLH